MKQKYWLRGGIITSVIGVILFVSLVLIDQHFQVCTLTWERSCAGIYPYFMHKFLYGSIDNSLSFTIAALFVIGALCSWLYGKIKNRNKVIN